MRSVASPREDVAAHLYWLEQSAADLPVHDRFLSSEELLRLHQLSFPKRRNDWRLGRWTAKRAVAAYLGQSADPEALANLEIRSSPSGAPEVSLLSGSAQVSISLSHRADNAMCVVAPFNTPIGCDLELIEPRSDSFVADYFTANEQALISQAPREAQALLVTLLWSAKESALKAMHLGLRVSTRLLEVRPDTISPDVGKAWRVVCPVALRDSELHCRDAAMHVWHPLQVIVSDTPGFIGCWRHAAGLVRTIALEDSFYGQLQALD
jgi:4'-phosphopantetheinyl transferase